MPTKSLPSNPSLDHLKHQAKDLIADRAAKDIQALQRIREFHPHFHKSTDEQIGEAKFTLADAQLSIAREYGFPSWARLKLFVENEEPSIFNLPVQERIKDPLFRKGVDLIDAGDAVGLRELLDENPDLVRKHEIFEGGNYFTSPSLLQFIAENPIRHGTLPPNIVEIARILLDAGAKEDKDDMGYTLALVCSGRIPRERGVQVPLIDLLCEYGARPNTAGTALFHGEFEAIEALLRNGAKLDLTIAAGTGRTEEARRLLPKASAEERHVAMALAAQHGHADVLRLLIEAGENPNRYNPSGGHSHSTPLHQAVWAGHLDAAKLLIEKGADPTLRDIHYQGTPLDWAEHGDRKEIAEYLRSIGADG